jgi:hypothetical protein
VFAGVAHAAARDYLFFSYTALTTTGYGNLVPVGDIGQILAVFEMLTGQFFLVTLVAERSAACRDVTTGVPHPQSRGSGSRGFRV